MCELLLLLLQGWGWLEVRSNYQKGEGDHLRKKVEPFSVYYRKNEGCSFYERIDLPYYISKGDT